MTPLETSLAFTDKEEGGYSADLGDDGNWSSGIVGNGRFVGTMHGISAPVLLDWVGKDNDSVVTADYMKALQPPLIQAIMTRNYWTVMNCSALRAGVGLMVFDHGVNGGAATSVRILQQALGFTGDQVDGHNGPLTAGAAMKVSPSILISTLEQWQTSAYRAMEAFPRYGQIWLGRVERRASAALALAASVATSS